MHAVKSCHEDVSHLLSYINDVCAFWDSLLDKLPDDVSFCISRWGNCSRSPQEGRVITLLEHAIWICTNWHTIYARLLRPYAPHSLLKAGLGFGLKHVHVTIRATWTVCSLARQHALASVSSRLLQARSE